MRASLKKIGLAAVMALTVAGTALVTAGSAQAQYRHCLLYTSPSPRD